MPAWAWIVLILLATLILGAVVFLARAKRRAQNNTIIKAVIDLYPSGGHHVEYIPADGVHPMDIVQLTLSYFANVLFVTSPDRKEQKQALIALVEYILGRQEISDPDEYRTGLQELAHSPQIPPLSDGRYTSGESERYHVSLIRGRNMDYSISQFSVKGYQRNLTQSTLLLYCESAQHLNDSYLKLMHHSMMGVLGYFTENGLGANNNQAVAFHAAEYALRTLPESIESS
ncbi:MAG: hypothetical protein KDE09_24430, partial [Anaerolineales bacterium]|nr:hypothetical protein [Anaerolineales bacterium]